MKYAIKISGRSKKNFKLAQKMQQPVNGCCFFFLCGPARTLCHMALSGSRRYSASFFRRMGS